MQVTGMTQIYTNTLFVEFLLPRGWLLSHKEVSGRNTRTKSTVAIKSKKNEPQKNKNLFAGWGFSRHRGADYLRTSPEARNLETCSPPHKIRENLKEKVRYYKSYFRNKWIRDFKN